MFVVCTFECQTIYWINYFVKPQPMAQLQSKKKPAQKFNRQRRRNSSDAPQVAIYVRAWQQLSFPVLSTSGPPPPHSHSHIQ